MASSQNFPIAVIAFILGRFGRPLAAGPPCQLAQAHAVSEPALLAQEQHTGLLERRLDLHDRRKLSADLLARSFEPLDRDDRNARNLRQSCLVPAQQRSCGPNLDARNHGLPYGITYDTLSIMMKRVAPYFLV